MHANPRPFPELLKEGFFTALFAAVLAFPLIGLKLDETAEGLVVITRFDLLAYAVLAVFAGKVALSAALDHLSRQGSAWAANRFAQTVQSNGMLIGAMALAFTVALPFLPFADRYVIDLATTILIYIMLGWGLNIVVGLAGLLDLGYVAFYAIGAYAYGLLAEYMGLSFWQALPLAGMIACVFGLVIGFPVLRLRGDYLAIVTLGFGEIVRIILTNWQSFTHGPTGVSGIPRPSFFGLPFAREAAEGEATFHQFFNIEFSTEHRVIFLYFLILLLALVTNAFALRLRKLPIGRALEALREDEIACRSLGINPTTIKLTAFALGALFAGFAGAFFATRQGFISPESFTFNETAIVLAIVVLAGTGSQLGVVLAAIILVGLPELGREFADFRMLFFGAMMIVIMLWRPRGIFAKRKPAILYKAAKT